MDHFNYVAPARHLIVSCLHFWCYNKIKKPLASQPPHPGCILTQHIIPTRTLLMGDLFQIPSQIRTHIIPMRAVRRAIILPRRFLRCRSIISAPGLQLLIWDEALLRPLDRALFTHRRHKWINRDNVAMYFRSGGLNVDVAEEEGFEPSKACTLHDFQSCSLDHYETPPERRERDSNPRRLLTLPLFESGTFDHSDISPRTNITHLCGCGKHYFRRISCYLYLRSNRACDCAYVHRKIRAQHRSVAPLAVYAEFGSSA